MTLPLPAVYEDGARRKPEAAADRGDLAGVTVRDARAPMRPQALRRGSETRGRVGAARLGGRAPA